MYTHLSLIVQSFENVEERCACDRERQTLVHAIQRERKFCLFHLFYDAQRKTFRHIYTHECE